MAWVPAVEMWLATTWDAALRVASEPEQFAADMPGSPIDRSFGSPTILTCDGEPHRELRRSIDPKYRPAAVEGYIDELVAPIVAEHLAALERQLEGARGGRSDGGAVRAGLGAQPRRGARARRPRRRHAAALVRRRSPTGATNFERDPASRRTATRPAAEIDERLGPLLDRLEREPDDSAISHMIHAGTDDGEPAPARELPAEPQGDPARRHAGAGPRCRLGPLRAASPSRAAGRGARRPRGPAGRRRSTRACAGSRRSARRAAGPRPPLELGGAELPADAPVAAVISSANRDPDALPATPTRSTSTASARRVATFGFGRHFCSGHAFARAQERIALRALLERYPALELGAPSPSSAAGSSARPRELRVRLG